MRALLILTAVTVGCGGDDPEKLDPCEVSGNICTWMGVPGEALFAGELLDRRDSQLYLPQDVEFAPDGTPYVVDFNNHRIRRVNQDDTVETVTGTGMLGDGPEGDALLAAWNHPTTLAFPPGDSDRMFVAAWHNSRINLVNLAEGTVEWWAGTGGRNYGGDGGDRKEAVLDLPAGVAFDDAGILYIGDQANHAIRRVNPDSGVIDTIAGAPREPGYSGDGGMAVDALLHGHTDQKADPGSRVIVHDRILYSTDTVNGVVRAIDLDSGVIDTIAGAYTQVWDEVVDPKTGDPITVDAGNEPGYAGDGGDARDAIFNTPRDLAMGPDGELYIADTKNSCIRVIGTDGIVETFAGICQSPGFDGDEGPASEALIAEPFGVSVDAEGNVYIADTLNMVIRRVAR